MANENSDIWAHNVNSGLPTSITIQFSHSLCLALMLLMILLLSLLLLLLWMMIWPNYSSLSKYIFFPEKTITTTTTKVRKKKNSESFWNNEPGRSSHPAFECMCVCECVVTQPPPSSGLDVIRRKKKLRWRSGGCSSSIIQQLWENWPAKKRKIKI